MNPTPLPRRRDVALALSLAACAGCASSDPPDRKPDHTTWTVRAQGIGTELDSCGASFRGWRGGPTGPRLGVLQLSDSSPLARTFGAFAGLEGAPVFDESGAFVGAVVSTVGQPECRLCAFTEAEPLERLWLAGRRSRTIEPTELAPATIATPVRPGDAVALAHWWSDSPGVACEFGTIADVRDNEAILLTTAPSPTPLALRGHDLQVLLAVRTVAIGSMYDRFARVIAARAPIGVVVYRGAQGCFAVLGRLPPSISLRIVIHSHTAASNIEAHIVCDGSRTAKNVSEFVTAYLRESGLARLGPARVSLTTSDRPTLVTTVIAAANTSVSVNVDRAVGAAIASNVPPPGASLVLDIALDVALDDPSSGAP